MRGLSQAPALSYKIQIQLNEIFFFYKKSINRILYHTINAKVDVYFKLSKFF